MGMDLCHSFSSSHDKVKSEIRKSWLVTGLQNYAGKLAVNYLKILCISGHTRYFIMWHGWFNDTLAMCVASLGNCWKDSENHSSFIVKKEESFFPPLLRLWPASDPCSPVPWLLWKHSFGLENNQFYSEETHFSKNVGEVWITEHL